ncbi:hypothetical protein [Streptomyces virginiae]|uniref:hypothetical protein n=1 Tax=Streptomyces virginiae TaxID=1961 RepID=UPI00386B3805|nr:hypothetical protein OG253_39830 [Streptomyces virginiae]
MTAAARVFVNEGTFGILDAGEIPIETADWSQGLLVALEQGALVVTGINTGRVQVWVRALDEAPPPETGGWEETSRSRICAPEGQLRVESLTHGPDQHLPLLSAGGPGWYEVEVKARGRSLAPDGCHARSGEHYLITAWPSPDRSPFPARKPRAGEQEEDPQAAERRQRLLRGGGPT